MDFYWFLIVAGLITNTHQKFCDSTSYVVICSNINQSSIYQISRVTYSGYSQNYDGFYIEHSDIKILPANFLPHSNYFRIISLQELGIERIVPGAFDSGMRRIKNISLKGNHLKKITKDVFSKLVNLEDLDLQHNNLEELEDSAFVNLNMLQRLLLNNNYIVNLPNNLFDSMMNLVDLDISHNNIIILDHSLFISNINLTILYASNNNISYLPVDVFIHNVKLQSLDLSYNPINHIDYNTFLNLPQLSMLNVSFTERKSVFNLDKTGIANIAKLSLDRNNIKEINVNNPNLTSLSLSGNNLDYINNTIFQHCVYLSYLNLSINKITEIESTAFFDLTSLKTLDLRDNKIEVLPHGLFSNLLDLEYLDISSNLIQILPYGIFDPLQNLTSLNISSNEISSITSYNMHSLRNLKQLYLDNNNIDYLDGNELSSLLVSLQVISLDNNLWICSKLIKLVHSLEKRSIKVIYGNTSHTHNVNKIKCDDMVTLEDSKDNNNNFSYSGLNELFSKAVSSMNDKFYSSSFYSFFKKDFKNTEFYDYFKNLKNYKVQTVSFPNSINFTNASEIINKSNADKLVRNEKHKENNYAGLEVVLYLICILLFVNISLSFYKFFHSRKTKRNGTYNEEDGASHTELVGVNA